MLKMLTIPCLLATLAGCQSRTADPVDEQSRQIFTNGMLQALQEGMRRADTGAQIGAVSLKITLDRQSAPIACEATRAPAKYRLLLPNDVPPTDFQALARLVEAQCWKNIYPLVPPEMMSDEGLTEIVAPLILMLPLAAQAPGSPRRQANAQRDYFWRHLLRDQPVNAIGKASVSYQADAQGKVEGCLVQLHPHPVRAAEFRLDSELQARLSSRCLTLNLKDLPGFIPGRQGYSMLEYAPWRVGRP